MSINKVMITGNLTRDAEKRVTGSGTAILSFAVAVNERHRNSQTGEWEDRPGYFDCLLFGARADALSSYMVKGTKVAIEGRLSWRQWQDQATGTNRSRVEIVVNEIEFMTRSNTATQQNRSFYESNPASSTPNSYVESAPSAYAQPAYEDSYSDEDIPF